MKSSEDWNLLRRKLIFRSKDWDLVHQTLSANRSGTILTTPKNTVTYHNALYLWTQNFAQALFSVSLGAILTPERNWRQCLCKIWGSQTKSIIVCYGIFWSGQFDMCERLVPVRCRCCSYYTGYLFMSARKTIRGSENIALFYVFFFQRQKNGS